MFKKLLAALAVMIAFAPTLAFPDAVLGIDTAQSMYIVAYSPVPVASNKKMAAFAGPSVRVRDILIQTAKAHGENPDLVLRLAKLESRYNPRAVGPRLREGDHAMGLLQVRPKSARSLGFTGSPSDLLRPEVGAYWGVQHIKMCRQNGALTDDQVAQCHVAGPRGLRGGLRASAERYKRQYVAMFRSTKIEPHRGWLSRGEGSLNVASLWN